MQNTTHEQLRITVPCCKSCNHKFSVLELRCKKFLDSFSGNIDSLTDSQISDLRTIAIKNAIGIIFHFYGMKPQFNNNIQFSIETNIIKDVFFENFIIWDFDVCPTVEPSLNPLLVFSIPNSDVMGIIKNNTSEIGDTAIGYSKDPFRVKFLYRNQLGLTVTFE